MTTPVKPESDSDEESGKKKEAEFLKKVKDRVWQLLQDDIRRDQERRGKRFGS